MELRLKGKIAIVTGGSMGIGKATAFALAREGVNLAICARNLGVLKEAAREIQGATGATVIPIPADVTSSEDVKMMVWTAVNELGGVDILVNNAVNSVSGKVTELPDAAWMNHIQTKIIGYVRCAREVIPTMKRRGGGRIINIAGMAARNSSPTNPSSGVTNSAVANLTKALSDEVAPDHILVNCVHPAATRTPRQVQLMQERAARAEVTLEEMEQRTVSGIPIGRMIEPDDIANLVVFLSSNAAAAITGQTIAVDGGSGRGVFY